jgi:3-oxoacyl-[acyl-carrier protein] reductase
MTNIENDVPVALITGGAGGIGLASAHRLSAKGFRVAITDLSTDALAAAVEGLRSTGATVLGIQNDVRDYDAAQRGAVSVMANWNRIDVLVNCAGVSQPKGILEITEAGWDFVIDTNLKGTFNWCKAVAHHMMDARKGRIVNISSVNANTGGSRSAVSKFAYAASKAGVLGLTRGLAQELGPFVTVAAICPGLIATQMTADLVARQGTTIVEATPLKRAGRPEDVAAVVEFLATVEPNFITGEVIDVDGGLFIN